MDWFSNIWQHACEVTNAYENLGQILLESIEKS